MMMRVQLLRWPDEKELLLIYNIIRLFQGLTSRSSGPPIDIRRRFEKGWHNFHVLYKPLADSWTVFDTSGDMPVVIDESE